MLFECRHKSWTAVPNWQMLPKGILGTFTFFFLSPHLCGFICMWIGAPVQMRYADQARDLLGSMIICNLLIIKRKKDNLSSTVEVV